MREQLEKWERRYAAGEGTHGFEPSSPLPIAASALEPGRALDIASGAGRHAIYLAERGWSVVAVEAAESGIARMLDEARRRGVDGSIEVRRGDLERRPLEVDIEAEGYDLVCDFYFLERPLFEDLRRALRPGGLFVAAIHVEDPSDEAPHTFLLRPGELRELVVSWGWDVLHEHEGPSESGHSHATAEIVARKPG